MADKGRSYLGIAKAPFLSSRTVEAHVTIISLKLGLDQVDNNRAQAVLAFFRSADAGN
jgi:DNA-binding NarL/FixJ family response regulator